ncbi:MAG: O-antigen ligase/tetratricopeptide (TPR) repeat protein [Porticoccaceae bacterium]|jgi:O-antigen ligase/tetratricopeptide (TPR) repeat protein
MPTTQPLSVDGQSAPHQGLSRKIVDAGLLAILVVAPLFMGGRHPLGELVFVSLVAFVTSAWLINQCLVSRARYTFSGVEGLLIAGVLLVVFQLVGLPQSILSTISPGLAQALPLWTSGSEAVAPAAWSTVSVAPHETVSGLSLFVAYGMLFTVLVQRLKSIDDAERMLKLVAVATLSMAGVGLAQYFFGNGRFLWVYDHPFRESSSTVMGTFQNRNHFAHFLALGIGPLIWWIWKSCQSESAQGRSSNQWSESSSSAATGQLQTPLLFIALGLCGVAVLLSLSRAGIAVFAGASLVCAIILGAKSLIGRKAVGAILAVTILTAIGAVIYGTQSLEARFESLAAAGSLEDASSGRQQIWGAVLRGVPDFIGLGSGVGTHRFVYPKYVTGDHRVEYSHAENGYLQVLLETGIAGVSLLALGLLVCGIWCFKAYRNSSTARHAACLAAVVAGIAASVVHSVVDFVWYIPACVSMTIFLIAIVWRLSRPAEDARSDRGIAIPRFVWCGAAVAMCGIVYVSLEVHSASALANNHWDSFHRMSLAEADLEFNHSPESLDQRIEQLEQLLEIDSANAKAHLNLASLLRLQFDAEQSKSGIPMPLTQIRDAANTSPFETREALDTWLGKILADRREFLDRSLQHARQAVALCPLQGEAYIFMAELNFLRESNRDHELALIDQALRTRPEAPPVLVTAGREALLAGDDETGLAHFKKVFTLGGAYQRLVIQALGRQNADFFFEQFTFDNSSLQTLRNHYAGLGNQEQSRIVGIKLAKDLVDQATSETGPPAATTWGRAQAAFVFLKDEANALQAARNAVASDPHEYAHRKTLVNLLVAQQKFDEAVPLLEWCLKQYPDNTKLKETLLLARSQIQQASFTTDSAERQ